MSGHKWTPAQRAKYTKTMAMKNGNHRRIKRSSHFYRLEGTRLVPVKVKKITGWVIE